MISVRLSCTAFVYLLSVLSGMVSAAPVPPTPQEQLKQFRLPAGFEIELVVSDPDIGQPMNLNFDARGRLWLTHSVEYPYPATGEGVEPDRGAFAGGGENPPRDRLTVIEVGEGGKAKSVVHFVSGLNIPIGNTPLKDGSEALVYGIPSIFHAVDTGGDGQADRQSTLYTRFGNKDVHGNASSFTRWIDGWIYGCHGFSNHSEVKDGGGRVVKLHSGNTYRFREDGSHFQQFTWGQVNPFGLTFDPLGNLYDADCHTRPVYQLLRGATYPTFGSQPPPIGFGPEMINHNHGSTGICGPAYYAAAHFPPEYRDNLFICNPVTGRVHRDKLKRFGSTYLCDSQADFITTEDKWFRPVDAMVGPDGALYIADFCNLIIGHYEAPLNHPDRDRTHGRVWRVVYKGTDESARKGEAMPDLTKLATGELVEQLGHSNLLVRTLATNYLIDAHAESAADIVKEKFQGESSAELKSHGLWVLERLGKLEDSIIKSLAADAQPLVRVHLLRALAERETWSPEQFQLARKALSDADPFVRRVAADALGLHPRTENVAPLLTAWKEAEEQDTHLIHTVRVSLLQHLNHEETVLRLLHQEIEEEHAGRLVQIAAGASNQMATAVILRLAPAAQIDAAALLPAVRQAAKVGSAEDIQRLIALFSSSQSSAATQLAAIAGLAEGLAERGEKPEANPALKTWLAAVAEKLLHGEPPGNWTNEPLKEHPRSPSPWGLRERTSADGLKTAVIDSIVQGEQKTGLYRSPEFDAPKELSFWLCGHSGGPPGTDRPLLNHIRLRRLDTGEIVAQENVPRNDIAQKVTWNLGEAAEKKCVLEIVDADTAPAYAWIGVGRFDPPVVQVPTETIVPLIQLLKLAGEFELDQFAERIAKTSANAKQPEAVRMAAAAALPRLLPAEQALPLLAELLGDAAAPLPLRTRAAQMLGETNSENSRQLLAAALSTASAALQNEIALSLAGSESGLSKLVETIEAGKASPLLLQQQRIKELLASVGSAAARGKAEELVRHLPPVEARTSGLIQTRLAGFSLAKFEPERGREVFQKHCAACHKLGDHGEMIGPQLDGIGVRGVERLLEDLLDPNRNVDAAFRTVTIQTAGGKVLSGLKRRQDGNTLIFADAKGQEFRVPTEEIEEQLPSALSLMPSNLVETLPEQELFDLLGFLLRQQPEVQHP